VRRLTIAASLLPLLAWAGAACAQAPAISPSMRGPTGYVQLQIVSGRLTLALRQAVRTRSSSSSSHGDRRERVAVDTTGVHPNLDYELVTSQWQLVFQASNQTNFRIARVLQGASTAIPFEFRQEETGDIHFTWGAGDQQRQGRFSTIWHLLLAEGEAAKAHLLPLLEFFRPGWNLAATMGRITDALFANADDQRAIPRQRWAQLVAQLSDTRYSRREAADRELRAEGKAVLSFLDGLPSNALDFEQRHRIRRIRRWLTRGDDNDATESIAAWLETDPRVWLALLSDPDLARRRTAAGQLSRLLGEEIPFDPAADAALRSQQIKALRPKLESPPPAEARVPAPTE
jgi:hypothetical protein